MTSTGSTSSHTRTVALAIVGVAMLASLAGCGGTDGSITTAPDPTASDPTTSAPTTSTSPTSSTTSPTSPTSTATGSTATGSVPTGSVPTYFVGRTPQGLRLFPEWHPAGVNKAAGALDVLRGTGPRDPDYRSLLPADSGTATVAVTPRALTVTLPSGSTWIGAAGLSPAQAKLGVQQVVWTVQEAAGSDAPVRVLDSAGAPATLLGVPTTTGLTEAKPLTVQSLMQVVTPSEGDAVSGTMQVSGLASSYEGNVTWQLCRGGADGPLVKKGYATASGFLGKLYPWRTTVSLTGLAAGTYTFVASTDSEGEGPGPTTDTKTVVVG